jgi:cephalosporin hydroxylase
MLAFEKDRDKCFNFLFNHVIRGGGEERHCRNNTPRWMGCKVIKLPEDLILYQQILHQYRPEVLIETGTRYGGSALFFANMFDILGNGQVITVDIKDFPKKPIHPRITYLIGSSISEDVLNAIGVMVQSKTCMVTLDSKHDPEYVSVEMEHYCKFVTPKQYMVVEDAYPKEDFKVHGKTIQTFLDKHPEFKKKEVTDQLLMHVTRDGWLQRQS